MISSGAESEDLLGLHPGVRRFDSNDVDGGFADNLDLTRRNSFINDNRIPSEQFAQF